jgi:putative nucleotidyltransferase with HDIG domain
MSIDTLDHPPSTLAMAAGTASADGAAAPVPARLAQLFRPRGEHSGAPHPLLPHPLLPLLRAYRDRSGQAHRPAQPPPAAAAVAAAPATAVEPPDLSTLTRRITALPPLPEAMSEVLLALNRSQLSANRSIELIEHDPALAARTLRLANSAFYGAPGRVASIGDAVRMLGLRTVAGVLAAVAVHNTVRIESCPGFRFQAYWQHAIATALAARELAPIAGRDADEAFLAGLVHDIGQLALAAFHPGHASASLALAQVCDLPAEQAEQAVLGMAHPQVGALLAAHWHFPAPIVQAIAHHHAPEHAGAGQRVSLSGLVQVADALAHALDFSADPHDAVQAIDASTWQALALQPDAALRVFEGVERGTREISALLLQL